MMVRNQGIFGCVSALLMSGLLSNFLTFKPPCWITTPGVVIRNMFQEEVIKVNKQMIFRGGLFIP